MKKIVANFLQLIEIMQKRRLLLISLYAELLISTFSFDLVCIG